MPSPPWREFILDEVLEYHDGPRLMLRCSDVGQPYLAWWNDADDSTERWLYLPVSGSRLRDILVGSIPARDALGDPEDGYLLVIDAAGDIDDVVQTVITNTSALPWDSLPMPGVTLDVSEATAERIAVAVAETVGEAQPCEYDAVSATLAIPVPYVLLLLRGLISGSEVVAQQLTALEAVGVTVVLGANGPHPDAVNNFARTIPVMKNLGDFIRSLPDVVLQDHRTYYYDALTGRAVVPFAQIVQLYLGLRGLEITADTLFHEMGVHGLLDDSSSLDVSLIENWNRAIFTVKSLHDFIDGQSVVATVPQTSDRADYSIDIARLFREIDEFLRQDSMPKLPAPSPH